MKMTFLSRRNALISFTGVSWGAGALVCVILLLFVRIVAPNFFWQIFAPVLHSTDSITEKSNLFFSSFSDASAIISQNEKLLNENVYLSGQNQLLLKRVEDLSALLGSSNKNINAENGILAGVVAHPPESPYDILVLSEGSGVGISKGQEVFGEGGVPIGVISSVSKDFSLATLFSSPNMSTVGYIGESNIPIPIRGVGAGAFRASINRSSGVIVGDTVFIPGPGMLPIGKVIRIDDDSSSPSVTLHIMPILNPFSVSWVIVRDTGSSFLDATSQSTQTFQ